MCAQQVTEWERLAAPPWCERWACRLSKIRNKMKLTWNELTINIAELDFEKLLNDWTWLLKRDMKPLLVSALGDVFLEDLDGSIHWLDTNFGSLTCIAKSAVEFKEMITVPENVSEWFLPQLIGDLIQTLTAGQCYSADHPPGLGGEFILSNLKPTDIYIHYSIFGKIFSQIQNLPVGTKLNDIKFVTE